MAQRVLKPLLDYEPGVFLTRDQKMSADKLVVIVKKIESKLAHYRRQRDKATKLIEGMKLKYGRNISSAHEHHEYDPGLYLWPDEAMMIDNLSIVKSLIVSKLASYGRQRSKAVKRMMELRRKGRINFVMQNFDDLPRHELKENLTSIFKEDKTKKKITKSKRPSFVLSDVDQEVSSDEYERVEEDLFLSDDSQ